MNVTCTVPEDAPSTSRAWQVWIAVKYEAGTILIVGVAIVLMWVFLGCASVLLLPCCARDRAKKCLLD